MYLRNLLKPNNEIAFGLSILFFLMIPGIGFVDYLTGPAITFGLIYLIPVSAIAWLNTRPAIVRASILTATTWISVDYLSGRFSLNILAYTWNFFSRFVLLLIVASLLSILKQELLKTQELSRRDPLTNALNNRGLRDVAEREIYRSSRSGQALTIAFLDVDNFKNINDTLGHSTGDVVLETIVESIYLNIRKSDVVARIGGDEFVILLPNTGKAAARMAVYKIHKILLDIAAKHNWSITFSFGVMTSIKTPPTLEVMIGLADKLLYSVKTSSKNNVAFSVYPDDF
jgi:diguanylate cyclase (GGDEF)-like protein